VVQVAGNLDGGSRPGANDERQDARHLTHKTEWIWIRNDVKVPKAQDVMKNGFLSNWNGR
jgi:hypothetical protein